MGWEGTTCYGQGRPDWPKVFLADTDPERRDSSAFLGSKVHSSQQHHSVGRYRYLAQLIIDRVELSIIEIKSDFGQGVELLKRSVSEQNGGALLSQHALGGQSTTWKYDAEAWASTATI